MKYRITKLENLPNSTWGIGDVVDTNVIPTWLDSAEPVSEETISNHTHIVIKPLSIKQIIRQPK